MKFAILITMLSLTACSLPASELPTAQDEGARVSVMFDFECYIGNTRTTYFPNSTSPAEYLSNSEMWLLRIDAINPHQEEEEFYYRQRPGEICGARAKELPLAATGVPSSTASTPTDESQPQKNAK